MILGLRTVIYRVADLDQARSMDHTIASEFAGYGVNECKP